MVKDSIENNSMEADSIETVAKVQSNMGHDSTREHDTYTEEDEKKYLETTKEILGCLGASLKIIISYQKFLQTNDENEFVFMAESRLPHNREKIKNAIRIVDSFIEQALDDEENLMEPLIEHFEVLDKESARYIFSEKYREVLKGYLSILDCIVSDEKAELGKTFKKVLDYIKENDITEDNLTALESEDFKKLLGKMLKAHKKSKE